MHFDELDDKKKKKKKRGPDMTMENNVLENK